MPVGDWLRAVCDAEVLATLERQSVAAKRARPRPPRDWRKDDWSWWSPGSVVAWMAVHDTDESDDVVLDGQTFVVSDAYCVEPGCECDELNVTVWRAADPLTQVGYLTVAASNLAGAQFYSDGAERALVQRVWTAWMEQRPVAELLSKRCTAMRAFAPELHAYVASKQGRSASLVGAAKVGPNKPCPCGSGLKFKKCCRGS